jgi:hypothetical protein
MRSLRTNDRLTDAVIFAGISSTTQVLRSPLTTFFYIQKVCPLLYPSPSTKKNVRCYSFDLFFAVSSAFVVT